MIADIEASENFERGLECALSILSGSEGDIDFMEFILRRRVKEEQEVRQKMVEEFRK